MRGLKRLTTQRIESARARSNDVWLSDNDGSRGTGRLLVRIGHSTRLFYFRYSRDRKVHTVRIGRYSRKPQEGYLTLEQARTIALRGAVVLAGKTADDISSALGVRLSNVVAQSPPRGPELHAKSEFTVTWLCRRYEEHLLQRGSLTGGKMVGYDIKNYIAASQWADADVNSLTTEDAVSLIREVAKKVSRNKANKVRATLSAAYSLAITARTDPYAPQELAAVSISSNPFIATRKLANDSVPLDRVLSEAELGLFWNALLTGRDSEAVKIRLVRVSILLGGQRAQQLARARPEDVDVSEAVLRLFDGKGNRKTPRLHYLPLLQLAHAEICSLLQECESSGHAYLFGSRLDKARCLHASTISHAVHVISDRLLKEGKIKRAFCYRDIRRTIETRMSEIDISKEVRAQVQSHDLGGVQNKCYNRSDFKRPKRQALEIWERYIIQCAEAVRASGLWPR